MKVQRESISVLPGEERISSEPLLIKSAGESKLNEDELLFEESARKRPKFADGYDSRNASTSDPIYRPLI